LRVRSVVVTAMVALVLVAIVAVVAADQMTPADAPVPAGLERWLGTARDVARSKAGLAGLVPFRFVSARCSADGRTAALAFEPVVGSGLTYAVIGLPSPSQAPGPIDATAIVGEASDEFAADTHLQELLSASCDQVLSP
jgi:hypothetical protein